MPSKQFAVKFALAGAAFSLILVTGTFVRTSRAYADDNNDESRIRHGFAIAPVPLNLAGKERGLVGLGSYLVNGPGDCNGCHSAGPNTQFSPGGNPYFGQIPAVVNPGTYLGGGRDFGPYVNLTHLYSRNLTPDKTGLPEGGRSFSDFVQIMRQGTDFDNLHPTCPPPPGVPPLSFYGCLAPPFDGSLLQVMPWPSFQYMTDHDLLAIYTYLSAIPCIERPADSLNPLHNDCN